MGLAERRSAEQFKNEDYPVWKTRIDGAAGFEVPVEVAWDELAVADYAERYAEYFPKVYFEPLVTALSAVAVDDLGKNALREGLSKIIIRNTDSFVRADGATLIDGVLTFDHKAQTNVDYPQERAEGLQKLLESKL